VTAYIPRALPVQKEVARLKDDQGGYSNQNHKGSTRSRLRAHRSRCRMSDDESEFSQSLVYNRNDGNDGRGIR
jgi:hypothetical protein